MQATTDLSPTVRFGFPILASLGAAYPTLFFWTAALDVGPYGSIRPIDWSRIATGWAVGFLVVLVVALVMWRLTSQPFVAMLIPATGVMWALAFTWRAVDRLDAIVSLSGYLTMAVTLIAIVVAGIWLTRVVKTPEGSAALALAMVVPLVFTGWSALEFRELPAPSAVEGEFEPVAARPDVWILVFDGMPSPESMRQIGWDPEPLVGVLETQGFAVAEAASSVSTGTYVSIGSSLALADNPPSGVIEPDQHGPWVAAMLGNHPLAAALVADGYEYVMVDNAFSFTRCGDLVTECVARPWVSDIDWVVLVNSLAAAFMPPQDPWRTHSLEQLDQLTQLADETSAEPRLVYAHLLVPHWPYDLDSNCSQRLGTIEEESQWRRTPAGFSEMMECVTSRLGRLVDEIPDEDVVVIIGDHGSDLSTAGNGGWTAAELADRLSAFVAIKGCDELDPAYLTSNANAIRGLATCVTEASFDPWPNQPMVACSVANRSIRLIEVSEPPAAGSPVSCYQPTPGDS